jgi:hypothetical protein
MIKAWNKISRPNSTSYLCFEDVVVGVKKLAVDDWLRSMNRNSLADARFNRYHDFRDYVFVRQKIKPKLSKLAVLVFRESTKRGFTNVDNITALMKITLGPSWEVKGAFMGSLSIDEQVRLLSQTAIYIAVPSSESHMAMFMPDGAVSVTVRHPNHHNVNSHLCAMSPALHCYYEDTLLEECAENPCHRQAGVSVNLRNLESLLHTITALGSIASIRDN